MSSESAKRRWNSFKNRLKERAGLNDIECLIGFQHPTNGLIEIESNNHLKEIFNKYVGLDGLLTISIVPKYNEKDNKNIINLQIRKPNKKQKHKQQQELLEQEQEEEEKSFQPIQNFSTPIEEKTQNENCIKNKQNSNLSESSCLVRPEQQQHQEEEEIEPGSPKAVIEEEESFEEKRWKMTDMSIEAEEEEIIEEKPLGDEKESRMDLSSLPLKQIQTKDKESQVVNLQEFGQQLSKLTNQLASFMLQSQPSNIITTNSSTIINKSPVSSYFETVDNSSISPSLPSNSIKSTPLFKKQKQKQIDKSSQSSIQPIEIESSSLSSKDTNVQENSQQISAEHILKFSNAVEKFSSVVEKFTHSAQILTQSVQSLSVIGLNGVGGGIDHSNLSPHSPIRNIFPKEGVETVAAEVSSVIPSKSDSNEDEEEEEEEEEELSEPEESQKQGEKSPSKIIKINKKDEEEEEEETENSPKEEEEEEESSPKEKDENDSSLSKPQENESKSELLLKSPRQQQPVGFDMSASTENLLPDDKNGKKEIINIYEKELETLKKMGYLHEMFNSVLLKMHNGDLDKVINDLQQYNGTEESK